MQQSLNSLEIIYCLSATERRKWLSSPISMLIHNKRHCEADCSHCHSVTHIVTHHIRDCVTDDGAPRDREGTGGDNHRPALSHLGQ